MRQIHDRDATEPIEIPRAKIGPREPDAPASASHGGQSSLMRLADAVAGRVRGGKLPWSIVAVLVVALAADISYRLIDRRGAECPPLLVQHVLWQAQLGAAEVERLQAVGEQEAAESIRRITSITSQASDVQLCTMLAERDRR
jgi:hypothetical protein